MTLLRKPQHPAHKKSKEASGTEKSVILKPSCSAIATILGSRSDVALMWRE